MISDYLSIALKSMKKRRLRSFLTLVGIMISIATIFVLISVSLGLSDAIQSQFTKLGGDKFFIQPRGQFGPPGSATAATLTLDDIETIKKVSGVKDVTGWTISPAKLEFKEQIRFVNIISIEIEKQELGFTGFELDEGRLFKDSDTNKLILGSQYKYNDYVGKQVKTGDTILINDNEFQVVGILKTAGNPSDDRMVHIPEEKFRETFNIQERVDFIIVQVSEENDINKIATDVKRKLMNSRKVKEETIDFAILTPEELLATFGTVLNIVTSFLFAVATISLVVGGINIANTMFTSVLERTREIGVMKAIGAKNKDILYILLFEAGILGLIGGVFGVLLGLGIAKTIEYIAVTQLATSLLQTSTPIYLFIGSLVFAFVAGAVSGLYPAWKATKIQPVDALRYE